MNARDHSGRRPAITAGQLKAFVHKHGFNATLIRKVYRCVARTHANAMGATDNALNSALDKGADPMHVARSMNEKRGEDARHADAQQASVDAIVQHAPDNTASSPVDPDHERGGGMAGGLGADPQER